jgi:hypothetical protein
MEVTKREILISVSIIAVMIGIGIWISSPILSNATKKYEDIASSVVVSDAEKFGYLKRTNAGNFIAEGTLSVIDTVKIADLPKPYSYIKKDKEEYRSHVETYTTTDSKGNTHVHTRTYWSWDVVKTWNYKSERGKFLGEEFLMKEVFKYREKKEAVIKAKTGFFEHETRYVYYTCPPSFDGIMVGNADNKAYNGCKFIEGNNAEDYLKQAEKSINTGSVVFWVLWIMLTAGLVVGFYALENKWLY